MLVGHSRLLLWFSVCKPSHHLSYEALIHHDTFVRIAIWNHKRLVKFLAVGLWLVALALNIYSTFLFPGHAHCILISRTLYVCRLDDGVLYASPRFRPAVLTSPQKRWKYHIMQL
jgi:hypothetical protein